VAAADRVPSLGVEVELGEDMIGGVARAAGQTVVAPPGLSAAFLLALPAECSGNERQGLRRPSSMPGTGIARAH